MQFSFLKTLIRKKRYQLAVYLQVCSNFFVAPNTSDVTRTIALDILNVFWQEKLLVFFRKWIFTVFTVRSFFHIESFLSSSTAWKVSKYGDFSCPYFSAFGLIEYGEIRSISPYLVRMQENAGQKKLHIWTLFTQCRRLWVV